MDKIKDIDIIIILKKFNITNRYIAEEMGYSEVHLSLVLNGHRVATKNFKKLFFYVIFKRTMENYNNLYENMENTIWKDSLPKKIG